ncbi:MAG TPA: PEP/pyruvate-binding domain-containing protein [Nitrospirota bacterium]
MKQPEFIQSALSSLRRAFLHRPPRDAAQFRAFFDTFQNVLDSNNRALETITDMGEKLGGEYLFDIVYVRNAYSRLKENIGTSLRLFDGLTSGRYTELDKRFWELDERIRHVIDETVPVPDALVIAYDRITGDMARIVGGKNSNLAEVKNAVKLSVPDAFAITTGAFDLFMRHNRIFEKVLLPPAGSGMPENALQTLREQVLAGTMPPELSRAIEKAVRKVQSRCGAACSLAVRSSAGEEDSEFSFAGQFETILNVPLDPGEVGKAYRKVVASLYSDKAAAYQQRLGFDVRDMKMAVAGVVMVDAEASGVVYSTDPEKDQGTLVINSTRGLGTAVVEGAVDADFFRIRKDGARDIVESRIGAKTSMVAMRGEGGVAAVPIPEDKRNTPSISRNQAAELARIAVSLESHFRKPQDIEWAIDANGKIFILQSRPLRIPEGKTQASVAAADAKALARNIGVVVQKGAASGRVFILANDRDLSSVPKGAVLVARRDSSQFVRLMTDVSAIITDTGTPTSHMAALCREFRIPTVVNAGHAARALTAGQEVTVRVDAEGATIYEGRIAEIVEDSQDDSTRMEAIAEFRKKRYLLRYIVPLNLVDPLKDEFTPKACRTMHDVLRFIHEKSVAELVDGAGRGSSTGAVRLNLSVPADLMLIDIGGGLRNPDNAPEVAAEQIESIPFRAVINGMTRPGLWRSDAVPLRVNDFMTSMLRVPDITTDSGGRVERNLAVISRDYANISLKFGYHFIVMDCFCGERAKNNHIYFRFAGGATDMTKRSRRLQLLAMILGEYGFNIKTKGDLIVARLANIEQRDAEAVLDQLGRLFSYTRQLDAVLNDDSAVERYARSFLDGNYELAEAGKDAHGP